MKTSQLATKVSSPKLPPTTPILAGYYYAVADHNECAGHVTQYSLMLVSDIVCNGGNTQVKIQQFSTAYKVLPDFINPAYLGMPVAQFWIALEEFLSWQPLLMQRGSVADLVV